MPVNEEHPQLATVRRQLLRWALVRSGSSDQPHGALLALAGEWERAHYRATRRHLPYWATRRINTWGAPADALVSARARNAHYFVLPALHSHYHCLTPSTPPRAVDAQQETLRRCSQS